MKRSALVLVLLAACGAAPDTPVAVTISEAALAPGVSVGSIEFYVINPLSKSGVALTCETLSQRSELLIDQFDLSIRDHGFIVGSRAQLRRLQPATGIIVAVDAFGANDGSGARVGFACQDGIALKAGVIASLNLVLQAR